MDFFKKIGEKLGFVEEENKTEQIRQEREKIKQTLIDNLKKINFTDAEIEEVLVILTKMEADVQVQKDLLIGTNINNPDPGPVMNEMLGEIRRLEIKAGENIKAKIAEIRARKSK